MTWNHWLNQITGKKKPFETSQSNILEAILLRCLNFFPNFFKIPFPLSTTIGNPIFWFQCVFWPRLNTGSATGSFAAIFSHANSTSVYGSIFQNNMDDSSFNNEDESLIKTITLPGQAFAGYQAEVSANSETACKVSHHLSQQRLNTTKVPVL